MKWLYLWAGPKMAGTCLQGSLLTGECRLSSWLGTTVPTGPSKPKKKKKKSASVKIQQPITQHTGCAPHYGPEPGTGDNGTQPHGLLVLLVLDTPWSRDQQDQNMTNPAKCMCNTKGIKEGWGTCWVADMEGKM